MVPLMQLWLPILLSAVFAFVASSLIHMALKYHNSDYHGLPNEDEVRATITKGAPAPGQYVIPYCSDHKDMGSEAMQTKFKEGPVGFLILRAPGPMSMGASLFQWFLFCLLVSFFSGYLGAATLKAGVHYLQVFQVVGTAAFMGYGLGLIPMGIWWGQPWRSVAKGILDALIYACLTAGAFGWLWPH
ncbi:MAG TPA: hypothetical protein VJ483_07075 [Holophagaceae bacterium]|nr:hypothetical protein [Holophagaceae bacterium]